jgi:hypothetical protein
MEFAACSQDSVPWFALTCGPEGTGSALVLLPKRGRAERHSGGDRVRRQFIETDGLGRLLHDVPHRFFRHAVSPCPPSLVDPANNLPRSIAAAFNHSCNSHFTQPGTGTVRTCPALPTNRLWPNDLLAAGDDPMSKSRLHAFSSRRRGAEPTARPRLPFDFSLSGAGQSLWPCSAVSQLPRRTPSFFAPLTRRIPAARSALSRPHPGVG